MWLWSIMKSWLLKKPRTPVRRELAWVPWSAERLLEVYAYLSVEHAGKDEEDAFLAVEWAINRFPPTSVIKTWADYDLAVERMRERVRHNLAHPQKWVPPMTRDDMTVPGDLRHRLFALYRERGIPLSFVRLFFESNYQELAAAKANGATHARGLSAVHCLDRCRIARELVDGKTYSVDALLSAYDDPLGDVPLLPSPLCGILNTEDEDGPQDRCVCIWTAKAKAPPGADPKFLSWMEDTLAGIDRGPFDFDGIECETEHIAIATARIEHAASQAGQPVPKPSPRRYPKETEAEWKDAQGELF